MMNFDVGDILDDANVKTKVNWIPKLPLSEPIIFEEDVVSIQVNEIIAINAIYGPVKLHHMSEKLSEEEVNQVKAHTANSINGDYSALNSDEIETRAAFIPSEEMCDNIHGSRDSKRTLQDLSYQIKENNIIYSVILSRNISETQPFKNRRYWRRTHIFGRLTVHYNNKYPLENPCLVFEFSLELPENTYEKFAQEIREIILNRSGDQECVFQLINVMEGILDDLRNYLQISEDLWEQMRRINNQKELERRYDKISITGSANDDFDLYNADNTHNGINSSIVDECINSSSTQLSISTVLNGSKAKYSSEEVEPNTASASGCFDDTFAEHSKSNKEHLNGINNVNFKNEFLLSKRLNQDFIVVEILFSSENVMITKSLHLIDQNNYQVSIYKMPINKYNTYYKNIVSKYSSLIMLQHEFITRYYQCWIEESVNEKSENNVYIYVQSECMNGTTLHDYLERKKIKNNEYFIIWSLFRQLLEIISYCHHNGVYHMSLSSRCIYLEEDVYGYSIKLSNFIFGTHLDFSRSTSEVDIDRSYDDIICIGEIFCEMWLKIKYKEANSNYDDIHVGLLNWLKETDVVKKTQTQSGAETASSHDTSSKDHFSFTEEMFEFGRNTPNEYKYIPKSALLILKRLLDGNSYASVERIDELLKSDLIPSSIDKHEFQYYLSRICNSKTYESNITINALFNRCIDKISTIVFLLDINKEERANITNCTFSDIVKTTITDTLQNHDFTLWKLPVTYPVKFLVDDVYIANKTFDSMLYKSKFRFKEPYCLIDKSNNLLCLSNSTPFSIKCSILSQLTSHNEMNLISANNLHETLHLQADSDEEDNLNVLSSGHNREQAATNGANRLDLNGYFENSHPQGNRDKDPALFASGIDLHFPVQRYFLQPIYGQPTNRNVNGQPFGPPKSNLSLSFDVIYNPNNQRCGESTSQRLNAYVLGNLMVELENFMLSLKIVMPWLCFLEEEPVLEITYFPLVKRMLAHVINNSPDKLTTDVEKLKLILLNDDIYHNANKNLIAKDGYLSYLFSKKYNMEWIYDERTGSYGLSKFEESEFVKNLGINDHNDDDIGAYFNVMNEIMSVFSDSSELFVYKNKRIDIHFNPLMDYDYNVYDSNGFLYTLYSSDIIYSIGGSNTGKVNSYLKRMKSNSVSMETQHSDLVNSVMGEVAIELIINKVCEKARKIRTNIINSGGYINNISLTAKHSIGNEQYNHATSALSKLPIYRVTTNPLSLLKLCHPRIIVMTQKNKLQSRVLKLTRRLWQMGVKSEYRLTPVQSLSTFLEKLKRETLIELLIILTSPNKTNLNPSVSHSLDDDRESVCSHFWGNSTQLESNSHKDVPNSNSNSVSVSGLNNHHSYAGNTLYGGAVATNPVHGGTLNNNINSRSCADNDSSNGTSVCRSVPNPNFNDNDNILVNYRIEHICGFSHDNAFPLSPDNTKIIMENEESVINYVIARKRRLNYPDQHN